MDEMRAMLDSLMGSHRNDVSELPTRPSFKDPGVCRSYLVDFCPHDLFPNTKSDLGPCPNRHSNAMKEMYQSDPDYEYYRVRFEKEYLEVLRRLVENVDERIRRGEQRIIGPDEAQIELEKEKKLNELKSEVVSLLQKAQDAGEKGNIAEAETYTRRSAELRSEMDRISNPGQFMSNQPSHGKSLRVCQTCGAMQSLGDATSRFESHVSGKQHVGYERIRAAYLSLKAKYDVEPKSPCESRFQADPIERSHAVASTRSQPGSTRSPPGSTRSQPGSTRSQPGSTRSQPGSTRSQPGSTRSPPHRLHSRQVSKTGSPDSPPSRERSRRAHRESQSHRSRRHSSSQSYRDRRKPSSASRSRDNARDNRSRRRRSRSTSPRRRRSTSTSPRRRYRSNSLHRSYKSSHRGPNHS